jgi:hypothetical protein
MICLLWINWLGRDWFSFTVISVVIFYLRYILLKWYPHCYSGPIGLLWYLVETWSLNCDISYWLPDIPNWIEMCSNELSCSSLFSLACGKQRLTYHHSIQPWNQTSNFSHPFLLRLGIFVFWWCFLLVLESFCFCISCMNIEAN